MIKLNFAAHARAFVDFSEDIGFVGGLTYFMPSKVTTSGIEVKNNAVNWEVGAGVKMGNIFIEGKYDSGEKQIIALIGIYF